MMKQINLLFTCLIALLLLGCGQIQPTTNNTSTTQISTPTVGQAQPGNPTATVRPNPTATQANPTVTAQPAVVSNPTEPIVLRFSEFYASDSVAGNLKLSQKMLSAKDKMVRIVGYMAPPLKPDLDFFVLTRIRLAVCPFCSNEASWPDDIILVTMEQGKNFQQTEEPLIIIGKLEIGGKVDKETGFYSMVRLRANDIDVFRG